MLTRSQGASNPVAAMPSLHAAGAAVVLLFFWSSARWWARAVLTAYALSMAFVLVYSGEHYVVDVLAGWLTATIGVTVAWLVSRRRRTSR